jgi:hypothetical protein
MKLSYEDFCKLVDGMRHAQKEYFRTRSSTALDESKRLERRVDEALRDDGQKEMFGGKP